MDQLNRILALTDLAAGTCRFFAFIPACDPTSRIIEQELELDCDLTVMGKHGESTLETLLLGSVTKHVLNESQNDVLISV